MHFMPADLNCNVISLFRLFELIPSKKDLNYFERSTNSVTFFWVNFFQICKFALNRTACKTCSLIILDEKQQVEFRIHYFFVINAIS